MTMGHFATALIPYSTLKGAPAWLLLVCAQLGDWFWLVLALGGVEPVSPESFLDITIVGMKISMPYSHTGAGTLVLTAVTGAAVFAVWKSVALAAWSAALVFIHWLQDLLAGWPHEVFTVGTPKIGLGLYNHSPYIAFAIEIAFSLACCLWFVKSEAGQGRPLSKRARIILFAVFVGGSTMFIPTAYTSFRTVLGM